MLGSWVGVAFTGEQPGVSDTAMLPLVLEHHIWCCFGLWFQLMKKHQKLYVEQGEPWGLYSVWNI